MIKLKDLLTESSTLSQLGLTTSQIKRAHKYGETRIKHDAKYDEIRSKSQLKKSLEDYSGHQKPILIGIRNDGKVYVAMYYNRGYTLRLIDESGKVEESNTDLSAKHVIRLLKGVRDYYISYTGRMGVRSDIDKRTDTIDDMFDIVVPIIEKYLSGVIHNRYLKLKKELKDAVDGDDFETASKISGYVKKFQNAGISKKMDLSDIEGILKKLGLMNSFLSRSNISYRENIHREFRDWIRDFLDRSKTPSESDVRRKAYQMAIDYKKNIEDEMDYYL